MSNWVEIREQFTDALFFFPLAEYDLSSIIILCGRAMGETDLTKANAVGRVV